MVQQTVPSVGPVILRTLKVLGPLSQEFATDSLPRMWHPHTRGAHLINIVPDHSYHPAPHLTQMITAEHQQMTTISTQYRLRSHEHRGNAIDRLPTPSGPRQMVMVEIVSVGILLTRRMSVGDVECSTAE